MIFSLFGLQYCIACDYVLTNNNIIVIVMKKFHFALLLSLIFALQCKKEVMEHVPTPPVAMVKDTILEKHGDKRVDPYFWMNQRDHADVIAYLEAENAYFDEMTAHTKALQTTLFEEMKARIKEDDASVPYFYNGYYYITRFEIGKNYPIYTRKKGSLDAVEEIMFDCNQMAEGQAYFNLTGISVSDDNQWVAYGVDLVSRRQYTLYIKNLVTGEVLKDVIENTTGSAAWAADNKTFFYTKNNEQTLRSETIFRHVLGTESCDDQLIYEEKDDTFNVFVYKEKSKKFIVIGSSSTMTSEYRILESKNPLGEFKVFQPRVRGLEYSISHFGNKFYVLTNHGDATNFKLMETPDNQTQVKNWKEVIAHREDVLLEDIEIFRDFMVIDERSNGLTNLRIINMKSQESYYLPFESETYTAYTSVNPDFDTDWVRFSYQSLKTPSSVIEFNMRTKEKRVLKEQEVMGDKFDKNNYIEERIWATARDGVKVPISLVYKKGMKKDGSNPTLVYGYGSYGYSMDPYFSTSRLSLLDRGIVYAIAHIRGGEDLGRPWYEDGKLLKKMNTFTDFIDCTQFLISEKYTNPKKLYAQGGSAGGLLVGAVANMAPELYNGIIAAVPFVDVVTTMLDDSIPLTTGEYDEWGNPNVKEYYHYMKSYSPYDNVKKQAYPHMLITTGYHDSQVQYWEPAKWVAKLRAYKTDNNKLLFHTNMDAGHGGASGRFESLKEVARDYSFILDLEGIKN